MKKISIIFFGIMALFLSNISKADTVIKDGENLTVFTGTEVIHTTTSDSRYSSYADKEDGYYENGNYYPKLIVKNNLDEITNKYNIFNSESSIRSDFIDRVLNNIKNNNDSTINVINISDSSKNINLNNLTDYNIKNINLINLGSRIYTDFKTEGLDATRDYMSTSIAIGKELSNNNNNISIGTRISNQNIFDRTYKYNLGISLGNNIKYKGYKNYAYNIGIGENLEFLDTDNILIGTLDRYDEDNGSLGVAKGIIIGMNSTKYKEDYNRIHNGYYNKNIILGSYNKITDRKYFYDGVGIYTEAYDKQHIQHGVYGHIVIGNNFNPTSDYYGDVIVLGNNININRTIGTSPIISSVEEGNPDFIYRNPNNSNENERYSPRYYGHLYNRYHHDYINNNDGNLSSIVLGNNSTFVPGAVSVGNYADRKQIKYVRAGSDSFDAVNMLQFRRLMDGEYSELNNGNFKNNVIGDNYIKSVLDGDTFTLKSYQSVKLTPISTKIDVENNIPTNISESKLVDAANAIKEANPLLENVTVSYDKEDKKYLNINENNKIIAKIPITDLFTGSKFENYEGINYVKSFDYKNNVVKLISKDETVKITNLSDGEISDTSTDAINGKQLKSYVENHSSSNNIDLSGYAKVDASNINKNSYITKLNEDYSFENPVGALVTDSQVKDYVIKHQGLKDVDITNDYLVNKINKGSIVSNTLELTNNSNRLIGLEDLTIELKDNSIDTRHIKDGVITKDKLNENLKDEIDNKVNKDASNLNEEEIIKLREKLGITDKGEVISNPNTVSYESSDKTIIKVGTEEGGATITNIKSPINKYDATNKEYVDNLYNDLSNTVVDGFKQSNAGIASAIATASTIKNLGNGKHTISASGGYYGKQGAMAIAYSTHVQNVGILTNLSLNSAKNVGFGVGLSYTFGEDISNINNDDINKLKKLMNDKDKENNKVINQLINKINELENKMNSKSITEKHYYIDNFKVNSYELNNDMILTLEIIAKENKGLNVEIIGYADTKGNDKYNLQLGLHRAREVAKYLASKGIDIVSIKSRGYNEIINDVNSNEIKNRRVEIIVK